VGELRPGYGNLGLASVRIPSLSKIGPVGNHVFGDVPMAREIAQRSGERLSKHILKFVSVISTHPQREDRNTRTLSEQV
ncbi:hypothetical protein QMK93_29290, partial [Klebsiella pneumoniae]